MSAFQLKSKYHPSGDQPQAIQSIVSYLKNGHKWQTLWGVTGSGKTFTMANVIEKVGKPTLIIAHNKTLAAQLAQEFKEFFPDAAVHYFVSYYDYYQPEAYVQKTDTYIEKEATINEEIDRLRHAATQDLLRRKDVIIVASVSCIYGIGDISAYSDQVFSLEVGENYVLEELIKKLVFVQYTRAGNDFKPGNFLVHGDILEIWPASSENVYTLEFWGDELSRITLRHPLSGEVYEVLSYIDIFPAKHTVTSEGRLEKVIPLIQQELKERIEFFESQGDVLRKERLKAKVEYDLEMLQEVGYVNGIENYSRYLDGRNSGEPPATLIDYFGKDFLTIIDESHMTIPQIGAMYGGDRSRKVNLVENGFRLPSAMDNRPLTFPEFEGKLAQVLAVSATPGEYEIGKSCDDNGENKNAFFDFDPRYTKKWQDSETIRIIPQMIRPTGLLDPEIRLKPMQFMVDDIMENLSVVISKGERMLITTLTKRSSEELTEYLQENGIKVQYLHSEVDTLERLEILKDLREGKIDVIVGVNLLREGLDLPEVSKIAILDADKQGFLRSESSLIQIIGRAARNEHGEVSMYVEQIAPPKTSSQLSSLGEKEQATIIHDVALLSSERRGDSEVREDKENRNTEVIDGGILGKLYFLNKGKYINEAGFVISHAMKKAIDLTYYRRGIQMQHNQELGISPQTVYSSIKDIGIPSKKKKLEISGDPKVLHKEIARLELEMDIAAANMEYEKAAEIRDAILQLKGEKFKKGKR